MSNLNELTAAQMAAGLVGNDFTSLELTQAFCDAITDSGLEDELFNITILENSLTKGQMIDDYRARREYTGDIPHPAFKGANEEVLKGNADLHPLAGVPIVVSDDIVTKGLKTTADLEVLADFVPDFDSHLFYKIKAAGLPFLGKTKNGTASVNAVKAGLIPWAICIDTAGNVKDYAKENGISCVLLKASEVSTFGVITTAPELIRVALIARNDEDGAILKDFVLSYIVEGER